MPVVNLLKNYNEAEKGSARIRAKHSDYSSIYSLNATCQNTTIIIQSTLYRGWKRYFEDNLGADDIVIDNTNQLVSGKITTGYIYVEVNKFDMEVY